MLMLTQCNIALCLVYKRDNYTANIWVWGFLRITLVGREGENKGKSYVFHSVIKTA